MLKRSHGKRTRLSLLRALQLADEVFHLRAWLHGGDAGPHPLAGDRAIEWSWVIGNLPCYPSRILDLGCVDSVLSCVAARLGHTLVAVDLREIEYEMERVTFVRGDFNVLDLGYRKFGAIVNCSAIEHVGLPGRYGSHADAIGDLVAMRKLRGCLAPGGVMILTIPVGIDALFAPWHRIYGIRRLPELLAGYAVLKQQFWSKGEGGRWRQCVREDALKFPGSERSYALGLFVLSGAAA